MSVAQPGRPRRVLPRRPRGGAAVSQVALQEAQVEEEVGADTSATAVRQHVPERAVRQRQVLQVTVTVTD